MKKEWFAAKELTGIAGLPSSPQGINLMARREEWESRRRKGVQGKALEYHINSLPATVGNVLLLKESPATYLAQRQDPLFVWVEAYYQLSDVEREKLVSYIMRQGISQLLSQLLPSR